MSDLYEPFPHFHPFAAFMKYKNVKTYQVLKEFGMTRQTLHNYLNYKREPTISRAIQFVIYSQGYCKLSDFVGHIRNDVAQWDEYKRLSKLQKKEHNFRVPLHYERKTDMRARKRLEKLERDIKDGELL